MRDFRRAGHELTAEQRAELEALRNRLVELQVAFARNINESPDWIEVDREGLDGLPDSYVERLRPGKARTYRVSLDYPEINPFMERATNRAHRETLFRKNFNQAADVNRPLLAEALEIRRRIAALLGHPTWAHYAMEVKMAADPSGWPPSTTSWCRRWRLPRATRSARWRACTPRPAPPMSCSRGIGTSTTRASRWSITASTRTR